MAASMMDVREYNHRNAKLWIWLIWMCTMVVSALYCVISVFCFQNVLDVYWNEDTNVKSHRLWAFLAATILAPAMVIGFFAFGTIILLCKTVGEGGLTYSYGALHVSALWMSVLVLQSGVTVHAYKEQMKDWEGTGGQDLDAVDQWDGSKTTLAQVSYVFGYILSIVYLALFIVLFIFRGAAQRLIIAPQAAKADAKKKQEEASAANTNESKGEAGVQPADAPEPEETVPIKKDSKKASQEVPEAKPTEEDKPKEAESGTSGFSWWRGKSKDTKEPNVVVNRSLVEAGKGRSTG